METVDIMIRIPQKVYEDCIMIPSDIKDWKDEISKAFKNSVIFPKGHGRLFILDEEKAKKYFTKFSFSLQDWISEIGISNATIKVIEADKESE